MKRLFSEKSPLVMKGLVFLFPLLLGIVKGWNSTILTVMLMLSLLFFKREWSLLDKRERWVLWGLVAFVVLSSFSLFNAEDLSQGFKRLKKMSYLLGLIPLLLYFRRQRIRSVMPFAGGMLIGSLILAVVAAYQVSGHSGWVRAHGYTNPILFGDICMLYALLITVLMMSFGPAKRYCYLAGICALAAQGAAILSKSRGPLLPLLPVLILVLILYWGKVSWKRAVAGLLLFVLLGGGLFYSAGGVAMSRISQGVTDIEAYFAGGNEANNVGSRFLMWETAWNMFREHPIIGSGLGDFRRDLREAVQQEEVSVKMDHGHAHSIYFSALGTSGILGFLGMILGAFLLPFYLFYDNWRRSSSPEERFCALGGMVTVISFACFGLTEAWFSLSLMVTLYTFCLLVFIAGSNNGGNQCQQPS